MTTSPPTSDTIRPSLVGTLAHPGPIVTDEARRVASGSRIRALLALFTVMLLLGLAGMMLLLVSSIFDRLTPSIRNDLEWKAEQGAFSLSQAMDVGIAAQDPTLIAPLAKRYLDDQDVAAVVVLGMDDTPLYEAGKLPIGAKRLFGVHANRVHEGDGYIWCWSESTIESISIGKVGLVVSLERLKSGLALKQRILVLAAAGCLAGFLLSLIFFRYSVSPLLRLIASAFRSLESTTVLALESTRLKSEFIANMSHEIPFTEPEITKHRRPPLTEVQQVRQHLIEAIASREAAAGPRQSAE
jgi:signal transduction histidine kinase